MGAVGAGVAGFYKLRGANEWTSFKLPGRWALLGDVVRVIGRELKIRRGGTRVVKCTDASAEVEEYSVDESMHQRFLLPGSHFVVHRVYQPRPLRQEWCHACNMPHVASLCPRRRICGIVKNKQ